MNRFLPLARCVVCCAVFLITLPVRADRTVAVPDVWKRAPKGVQVFKNGFAWFQCVAAIPDEWKGSDLQFFAEPIDDAREYYFNGQKIGAAGSFPPGFRSGLGGASRFRISAESVRFGADNVVSIRVFHQDGRGNFNVAAPVIFGGKEAVQLHGNWRLRPGDDPAWAREKPESLAKTRFAKREDRETILKNLKRLSGDEGPFSPQDSLARMETADDLQVELALADPDIGQPLNFSFDARGRLWVMQYLQYPNPAGLKMVSRDKYLRTVYDKVPPPPIGVGARHFRGADKITIHEDKNGDGYYETQKTFVDGLNLATSFAQGLGGVWVLNPPYLMFYPDQDQDDRPDGDPVVHLQGFGIEDSHSIANNLRFGPDGWLYAAQGSTVSANIIRPGLDKKPMHSMGQLIWRYHPPTRRYEIFAEGGGNAFGLEIDSQGRIFSGHNGGDTRGFHYVQGGYYRKGFGKHGSLSNPFAFGYFDAMPHHSVPRFTHAFLIYESGALPSQYHGDLFGVAPLQSHVVRSKVHLHGASFKTKDEGHPLRSKDSWFRPVQIKEGPDGAIYVADFYEQRIDHASHYQGRVHPESGRIFRLSGRGRRMNHQVDLTAFSTPKLIQRLSHPYKWHRQAALRLLADRKDESAISLLEDAIAGEPTPSKKQQRVDYLWALYQCGGWSDAIALKTLRHDNPYIRLWTIRLLADEGRVSQQIADFLEQLAEREPHVEVRCQLACSASRLPAEQSLPIVSRLLGRDEDARDVFLPLLLWWGLEAKVEENPQAVVHLFKDEKLWQGKIVRQTILERLMRRFAQKGRRRDLIRCAQLMEMAPTKTHSQLLMKGFEAAFEGRTLAAVPDQLARAIAKAGGLSLALRLRQGDEQAVANALKLIAQEKTKKASRLTYIQILGQAKHHQAVDVLLDVAKSSRDTDIRAAAMAALQSYREPRIGRELVKVFPSLSEESRIAAGETLASRPQWTVQFLRAVDEGKISPNGVGPPTIRRMLLRPNPEIEALVRKNFGEIEGATTAQMRQDVQRFAQIIGAGSGNPYEGKRLYHQSCGKCHQLFGEGGRIGPDLTSYKRDDLQSILLNVVNPSAEIREGYENYLVITADGRTLNGFITEQDNRLVMLRTANGQSISIPRDEIEEMSAIPRSIMPDGILKTFDNQKVRDLFAFLRATQPLP